MASWTTPTIYSVASTFSVTAWNAVANNTTFLYQAPYANYYNTVSTSIPNNTPTVITLAGTTASGYGFALTSNNAVVPLAGIYCFSIAIQTSSNTGSNPDFLIGYGIHNGSLLFQAGGATPAVANAGVQGTMVVSCTTSDTLGLQAVQNSGSTLATVNQAASTFISIFFVGSA